MEPFNVTPLDKSPSVVFCAELRIPLRDTGNLLYFIKHFCADKIKIVIRKYLREQSCFLCHNPVQKEQLV